MIICNSTWFESFNFTIIFIAAIKIIILIFFKYYTVTYRTY